MANDAPANDAPASDAIDGYLPQLHPLIGKRCAALFRDGHYGSAVFESAKTVFHHLREKTGIDKDGTNLAEEVFGEKNPVLALGDLKTESGRNEQVGFMQMLAGFARGVRNPLAHGHNASHDRQVAFEYLVMASLLCRRIDEARNVELELTVHPPLQIRFRGERIPCTFEIDRRYEQVAGPQWKNNGDVSVRILSPQLPRRRAFLIPSAAAPNEYGDPRSWEKDEALLAEKQEVVARFVSANLSRPIRGVWFELTPKIGPKRPAVYASRFDAFLQQEHKEKIKGAK